ncbi:hypothetical protein GbCGDNIH6_8306 [Granulibacter bethesdensis]|nr:hypothetical protein GbCGDNIH6_8306 [Granulibacter bethesdensis]
MPRRSTPYRALLIFAATKYSIFAVFLNGHIRHKLWKTLLNDSVYTQNGDPGHKTKPDTELWQIGDTRFLSCINQTF